jgi:hypothetical protein
MLAASPAEALALFERTKKEDRLVQDKHHKEVAGRHFSDILGILGDELQSPSDCPERIMPLWLAHTASRLFRAQPLDRAKEWGLQFYAELKRLDGKLPFTVIHDWHANVVEPFAIKFSKRRGPTGVDEWRRVLCNAFSHIYAGRTFVNLNNIDLNNMGKPQDKDKHFDSARLAVVHARNYSVAFASAAAGDYALANSDRTNPNGNFDAYAAAVVQAYRMLATHARLHAYTGKWPPYDRYIAIQNVHERAAFTRIAEGLLDCMARVAG